MPLTAKRDLYVQLMNLGMNNSEACRQVGVNRKTGQRWPRPLGRVVKDGEFQWSVRDGMVALVGCGPVEGAAGCVVEDVLGLVDEGAGTGGGEVEAAW